MIDVVHSFDLRNKSPFDMDGKQKHWILVEEQGMGWGRGRNV